MSHHETRDSSFVGLGCSRGMLGRWRTGGVEIHPGGVGGGEDVRMGTPRVWVAMTTG